MAEHLPSIYEVLASSLACEMGVFVYVLKKKKHQLPVKLWYGFLGVPRILSFLKKIVYMGVFSACLFMYHVHV